MDRETMKNNKKSGVKKAVNQSSAISILHELDVQLKIMNDKIDDILNLLHLYMEFEEVVRSYILEDNPSLEKQLESIEECKADVEPERITDDLEILVEKAVSLMEQLKSMKL